MRKRPEVVSLAAALAALVSPAAAPPVAAASDTNPEGLGEEEARTFHGESLVRLMDDGQLMRFTVHRVGDGLMFPQHGSHSSHSSHASHASSSPGGGGGGGGSYPPYVPGPYGGGGPYVPYVPGPASTPTVSPPGSGPVAPPPATSSTAPPAGASTDIARVACTRASSGLGVNDIASELQRRFGVAQNDAVSIAQQALTAVLAGGHFCDAYLGPHQ